MTNEIKPGAWLTTRQCADRIGVSTDFIRGEIEDRRLKAHVVARDKKRLVYRVSLEDFEAYLRRHHGRSEQLA